ncbi:DUF4247 domain-containing protein [Mycolicibacterium elephantis]
MSRTAMFWLAGGLGLGGIVSLILGISMLPDIRTHVAENYPAYSHGAQATNYECTGSPAEVADRLANYKSPEARATDRGSEYLRYNDDVVIVGPDGNRPCTIRVEDVNARYSHGGFIFLGPGFFPGSPAGGAGGSPGGPGGSK